MPFADDVAAYIDSNSTAFTAGTNLFVNVIRDSTSDRREVFVIEVQGEPAIEKLSAGLPAMTRPSADVIVRSTKAIGGDGLASSTGTRTVAQNLWGLLVGVANTSVNGKTYQRITAAHDPYLMGRDQLGRALFGFTVDGLRAPTTA
jgi:hypothetical protein